MEKYLAIFFKPLVPCCSHQNPKYGNSRGFEPLFAKIAKPFMEQPEQLPLAAHNQWQQHALLVGLIIFHIFHA